MTDRACVHTGNASEQFLLCNRTLILVHTVSEQLLKRSKNLSGKATFHLTISMRGQRATGKIQGIITITGVAGLL